MTRDEALAAYDPIREMFQDLLSRAADSLLAPDLRRAAKALGMSHGGRSIVMRDGSVAMDMLNDIALMEHNPLGVRPFDRSLQRQGDSLPTEMRALAERVRETHFVSLFKETAKHPACGLLLHDQLHADREIWLMDRSLDGRPPRKEVYAMRLFDAGPFHVSFGFGCGVKELAALVGTMIASKKQPPPFRQPMAAAFYAEHLGTRTALLGSFMRYAEAKLAEIAARERGRARPRDPI